MDLLPSLSRITVAVLGFVAVLVLHESLITNNKDRQSARSDGENPATTVAVVQSDSLKVTDPVDHEVRLEPDVSGQDTGTPQLDKDVVVDTGEQSESPDEFPSAAEDGQEEHDSSMSAGVEDDVAPPASSTAVAVLASPSLQWSAVWRPFFSPSTAQGFADYVSESTGLILRVQPSEVAGHYLVEVQHGTEAERIDADRRIVEFTGFTPPGAVQ